jgi:hypothetical protein
MYELQLFGLVVDGVKQNVENFTNGEIIIDFLGLEMYQQVIHKFQ